MGPDSGMPLSTAIQGHMPPRFGGGVALVPAFFSRSARAGRFAVDNHSGMREIKEIGFATP